MNTLEFVGQSEKKNWWITQDAVSNARNITRNSAEIHYIFTDQTIRARENEWTYYTYSIFRQEMLGPKWYQTCSSAYTDCASTDLNKFEKKKTSQVCVLVVVPYPRINPQNINQMSFNALFRHVNVFFFHVTYRNGTYAASRSVFPFLSRIGMLVLRSWLFVFRWFHANEVQIFQIAFLSNGTKTYHILPANKRILFFFFLLFVGCECGMSYWMHFTFSHRPLCRISHPTHDIFLLFLANAEIQFGRMWNARLHSFIDGPNKGKIPWKYRLAPISFRDTSTLVPSQEQVKTVIRGTAKFPIGFAWQKLIIYIAPVNKLTWSMDTNNICKYELTFHRKKI